MPSAIICDTVIITDYMLQAIDVTIYCGYFSFNSQVIFKEYKKKNFIYILYPELYLPFYLNLHLISFPFNLKT